jgi:hypothetical protein
MNKIARLLTATLFVLSFCQARAQTEVTYGPVLGFSAAGLYTNDEKVYAGMNLIIGGTAHIQLGNYFAIQPSLLFRPGMYMSDADFLDTKIALTRVSVPIPLMFSRNFESGNKFYLGAGPNFMYALSGKIKEGSEEYDIDFEELDWKRMDLGLHFKGGFKFDMGLSLNLFFNAGLTNLAENRPDYTLRSLDAFGFSMGWMFGGIR